MGLFRTTHFVTLLLLMSWCSLSQAQLDINPVSPPVQAEATAPNLDLDQLLELEAPDEEVEFKKEIAEEVPELAVDDVPPARPARDAAQAKVVSQTRAGKPVRRGPIHEAFATPIQNSPTPNKVIRRAPPAPVDEIPPTVADNSRNTQWIPGYWAWHMQTKDYLWVSGVWRKTPKDRVWMPGRWEQVKRGYQWVPGVWLPTTDGVVANKEILPLPPKSLEKGPTRPAPSEEHFWIPGNWQRDQDEYTWTPGYWARSQEKWVWTPDHYVWDPNGCVFVPGFWDYTWERRGTLYAPCTFAKVQPNEQIRFRPTKVVDADQWLLNLWMGPRTGRYYFGDYYDFTSRGYTPWYRYYGSNRGLYDPLYSYYRWQFPATYGMGLYGYLNRVHTHYGSNIALRPSVRICPYDQLRTGGYGSLYGDVFGLSRSLNIDRFGPSRIGYDRYGLYDDFYRRPDRVPFYGNNRARNVFRPLPRRESAQPQRRTTSPRMQTKPRNTATPTPAARVKSSGPVRKTPQTSPRGLGPLRTGKR